MDDAGNSENYLRLKLSVAKAKLLLQQQDIRFHHNNRGESLDTRNEYEQRFVSYDDSSNDSSSESVSSRSSSRNEVDEISRKPANRHKQNLIKVESKARRKKKSKKKSKKKPKKKKRDASQSSKKRSRRNWMTSDDEEESPNTNTRDTWENLFESQALEQQKLMLELLSQVDNQLQERIEDKRRDDFERRLEEKIVAQNKTLLESVVGQISRHKMSILPGYDPSSPNQRVSRQNSPSASIPQQLQYYPQPGGPNQPASPNGKSANSGAKTPVSMSPRPSSQQRRGNLRQNHPSIVRTLEDDEGKVEKTIWERLMQDDDELFQLDDNDGEKQGESQKKETGEDTGKKRLTKVITFGKGQPMYRWRKEGVENPKPEEILKGKPLFRSIGYFVIAIQRMKLGALEKKKGLAKDDIKEMQKAILWFSDRTKTWAAQVLTLPLLDLQTRALDSKGKGGGTSGKIAFPKFPGMKRVHPSEENEERDDLTDRLVLRLKVRIRGILELLLRSLDEGKPHIPDSICAFLYRIASDGCSFPTKFLFDHEETCLEFSSIKQTRWMILPAKEEEDLEQGTNLEKHKGKPAKQNHWARLRERKKAILKLIKESDGSGDGEAMAFHPKFDLNRVNLVVGNFVLTRCVIPVLLRPWESGIGAKPDKKHASNFGVIATLFYKLIQQDFGGPNPGESDPDEKKKTNFGMNLRGLRASKEKEKKDKDSNNPDAEDQRERKVSNKGGLFSRFRRQTKVNAEGDDQIASSSLPSQVETNSVKDIPEQTLFPSIYDITQQLLPQKSLGSLSSKLGFLNELSPLFHLCLLSLMEKTFASTNDTLPEGLLDQIRLEKALLRKKCVSAERRSIIKRKADDLAKRQVLSAIQAANEDQTVEVVEVQEEAESKNSIVAPKSIEATKERSEDEALNETDEEGEEDTDEDEENEDDEEDDDDDNEDDNEDENEGEGEVGRKVQQSGFRKGSEENDLSRNNPRLSQTGEESDEEDEEKEEKQADDEDDDDGKKEGNDNEGFEGDKHGSMASDRDNDMVEGSNTNAESQSLSERRRSSVSSTR